MPLTFRAIKGSPLTHDELDNNFREVFYSASFASPTLSLYKDQGTTVHIDIPLDIPPAGCNFYIQYNSASGATTCFSATENFRYDYNQDHLLLTGSFHLYGNTIITGSLSTTEDLYATKALELTSPLTICLGGALTGSTTFCGSEGTVYLNGTITTGSVDINTGTTGSYVASVEAAANSCIYISSSAIHGGIATFSHETSSYASGSHGSLIGGISHICTDSFGHVSCVVTGNFIPTGSSIYLYENTSIGLNTELQAGCASSGITRVGTAGEIFCVGDPVQLHTDGCWYRAGAKSCEGSIGDSRQLVAVAANPGSVGNIAALLMYGNIKLPTSTGFTSGSQVYVGLTSGSLTQGQISGSGEVIRVVGFMLPGNELLVNPSPDYITHT